MVNSGPEYDFYGDHVDPGPGYDFYVYSGFHTGQSLISLVDLWRSTRVLQDI